MRRCGSCSRRGSSSASRTWARRSPRSRRRRCARCSRSWKGSRSSSTRTAAERAAAEDIDALGRAGRRHGPRRSRATARRIGPISTPSSIWPSAASRRCRCSRTCCGGRSRTGTALRRHYFRGVLARRIQHAQAEHHEMLAQISQRDLAALERTVRAHNQGALASYAAYLEATADPRDDERTRFPASRPSRTPTPSRAIWPRAASISPSIASWPRPARRRSAAPFDTTARASATASRSCRWKAGTGRPTGEPSDLTRRRWRHFGQSGAKLIWGGEAVAVRPEGRANPHQLMLTADTVGEHRARCVTSCSTRMPSEFGANADRRPLHRPAAHALRALREVALADPSRSARGLSPPVSRRALPERRAA